jgi:hypothetical protein
VKHILPRILNPDKWTLDQISADKRQLTAFIERQKRKYAKEQQPAEWNEEDEWIRKHIIKILENLAPCHWDGNEKARCIAYLERQKEQKPKLPKPHKGDDTNPYDMGVSEAQDYAINRGFDIPLNDGEVFVDERYITQTIGNILRWADEHPKEQKPTGWEWPNLSNCIRNCKKCPGKCFYRKEPYEWSEEDIKKIRSEEYTKGFNDAAFGGKLKEWSEEDEKMIERLIRHTQEEYNELCNDRYGHQEIVSDLKKSCRERMNWLENRLKFLCPQPKRELYEEDNVIKNVISYLNGEYGFNTHYDEDAYRKGLIRQLKSLQPHWKPSDEQMRAVFDASERNDKLGSILRNLYDDLKKL